MLYVFSKILFGIRISLYYFVSTDISAISKWGGPTQLQAAD